VGQSVTASVTCPAETTLVGGGGGVTGEGGARGALEVSQPGENPQLGGTWTVTATVTVHEAGSKVSVTPYALCAH
jgi:hypothetical protein